MFYYPGWKSDGSMLNDFFTYIDGLEKKTLVQELKDRGYDVKTLRFSIMKDPTHPRWKKP